VLASTDIEGNTLYLREVITLAAAVDTIQTKDIAAGLIVLKFHRSICHKSAKIIGHNVSLTKKYSVILIYFQPMEVISVVNVFSLFCLFLVWLFPIL
jgi:hypothetical protein